MSARLDPVFGCEIATGRRDKDGYAFHGSTRAHIAAWELEHGRIEPGMELDHLCRRRACQALHHLELVTRGENERRKSWRYRARIKRCPQGHDLELYAIVTPEGGRVCRRCNRQAMLALAKHPMAEHGEACADQARECTADAQICQASGLRTDPDSVREPDDADSILPGRVTP